MKEETKQLLSVKGEVRIAEYLAKIIDDGNTEFEDKIIASNKNLDECWKYITYKAKKQAVNGCACIDDDTVYGWARKFYDENGEPDDMEKPVVKAPAKKKETTKAEKADELAKEIKEEPVVKPDEVKSEDIQLDFTSPETKEETTAPAEEPSKEVEGEDCKCAVCGKKMIEAYPDKSLETIRSWAKTWTERYGAVFCSKEHMTQYLADKEAK